MRIAHLILTHKNPAQLERLIDAISHPAFDFYIHLDKKVDKRPFRYLAEKKNVFFIANRATVYWAGYGTIQATINGFKEILEKESYDYINVLSAQDFPLKPPTEIYNYIASRKGAEFITCESIEDEWITAAPRVLKYHLVNFSFPGKYRLENLINRITGPRKFPIPDFKIVGRSNWFTITANAASYMLEFLDKNPRISRYFKFCWGGDEFIFASALYNSHFRDRITENLMYVDWTGQTQGHPRILLSSDLPVMLASGKLFARKMDMFVDNDLLLELEDLLNIRPERTTGDKSDSQKDHTHSPPQQNIQSFTQKGPLPKSIAAQPHHKSQPITISHLIPHTLPIPTHPRN